MVNTACLVAQGFVAEEGRSQGHRNCRTLTKERKPDKRANKHNRQQTKSKVKGSKKHETYTQGRLTVHLTKETRISTKGLTG